MDQAYGDSGFVNKSLCGIIDINMRATSNEIWFSQNSSHERRTELNVPQLIVTCIVAAIILTGLGIILYGCCTTPSQRCKCRWPHKTDHVQNKK